SRWTTEDGRRRTDSSRLSSVVCRPSSVLALKRNSMPRGPWIDHFGDNFLWSNATLIIKGMAPYGVVALAEIDRVCERLKLRQHEPRAWSEEWGALGDLVERRAEEAARKGHKHSAGDYY